MCLAASIKQQIVAAQALPPLMQLIASSKEAVQCEAIAAVGNLAVNGVKSIVHDVCM